MTQRKISILAVALFAAAGIAGSAIAAETVFPKKTRQLTVKKPEQCQQWTPPVPDKQVRAEYPDDAKGLKGDAALLVRIGPDGSYQGLVDYLSDEETYVKAAEKSLREWTFVPAQCNGAAIASDARVDFQFRKEGAITYSNNASAIKR
jgi:hypothetical protein